MIHSDRIRVLRTSDEALVSDGAGHLSLFQANQRGIILAVVSFSTEKGSSWISSQKKFVIAS